MLVSMRAFAWLSQVAVSILITSQPVFAKTVFTKGDWQLDDSNPADPKSGTCVASTATYFPDRVIYSLDVVIDKAGAMPLEIYINPSKSPSKVQALGVELDRGVTYNFALLPRVAGGTDTYWNIPRGTDAFINELKNGNQININAIGAVQGELPFSLSGSTATINELQRRCGAQSWFTAVDFEKVFLPPEVNAFDVLKLTPDQTDLLRKTESRAVGAYRIVLNIQNELAVLEARFVQLTQEQASLQASLDQLINRDLVNLTQARNAAQGAIDTATAEIASLQTQIATQQGNLLAAQAAYQAAYNQLQPLVPEHDRLTAIVNADSRRLSNAQQQLNSIDQNIFRDQQDIASLQYESSQLRGTLAARQNDLQRAQIEASQAQSQFNSFNPQIEIQRRMNSDGRLNQIDSDIRGFQNQVQNAGQQVRFAQGDRDNAARALQQCLANGGRMVPFAMKAKDDRGGIGPGDGGIVIGPGGPPGRGPGGGFPGGPGGRPGGGPGGPPGPGPGGPNPPPPPPPPPPPAPDCSGYRNQLSAADARLSAAQNTLSQAQWQLQNRINDRNGIVSQIQNEVYRQRDDLAAWVSRTQAQVVSIQGEINNMSSRLADIEQNQLPNLQNELSNLQLRRGSALSELQAATNALNGSTGQLQAYNRSVNWDALKAQVDQTAATVANIQAQIAGMNSQVAARQRLIQQQTMNRDGLDRQIAAVNVTIQQKQTRLNEVQQLLAPYNQQKADIMGRLTAAQNVVAQISRDFAAQLPH